MTDDIIYNKIVKALELVCPLYTNNLITEAYIVGSVAKGTARKDSDIDIVIVNSKFKYSSEHLSPIDEQPAIINNIITLLSEKVEFKEIKKIKMGLVHSFWYQLYKDELFHFMPQQESVSIKKAGEYISITKEFCDIVKIE